MSLSDFSSESARKYRHRRIDFGQRRGAQEQARREPFVGTPEHPAGIMGLDQALDPDGEIGDRSLGQYMRDIAERVLMHMQPRVGGDVNLPVGDILPVMAARRHPQDLNNPGRRRFVAIGGGMGDAQAHEVPGRVEDLEDRHCLRATQGVCAREPAGPTFRPAR